MESQNVFRMSNTNGHVVELPLPVAEELLGMLNMDAIFKAANAGAEEGDAADGGADAMDAEDPAEQASPLKAEHLEYSDKVLDVVRDYALLPKSSRTETIPRPLTQNFSTVVTTDELALVKAAEADNYLVDLLNCAMFLRFTQLTAVCAAYMAVRIDEIAKGAPDIMEGAERIRGFLHMENEWTEEEMGHLRKEMEYAKSVDSNVY